MKSRGRIVSLSLHCSALGRGQLGQERRIRRESALVSTSGCILDQLAAGVMMCRASELTTELARVNMMPKVSLDLPFTLFNLPPQQVPSATQTQAFHRMCFSWVADSSFPSYYPSPTPAPPKFVFEQLFRKNLMLKYISRWMIISVNVFFFPGVFVF